MDVLDPEQVAAACQDVDAVYYLIHGMGGDDFAETDRKAARNVAAAVRAHGSTGSSTSPASSLTSRTTSCRSTSPPAGRWSRSCTDRAATVVVLRAAVLIGSGSTSFEIIRQVSERLPVHTVPTSGWSSMVQPVAVVDALEALVGALDHAGPSRHFDVGGPDRLRYGALLDAYTTRPVSIAPQVSVPLLPTALVGTLVGSLTDVPRRTVEALVESLRHDMVAADDAFRELLPEGHTLMGLDEALRRSLAPAATGPEQADAMGPMPQDPVWAGGGDGRGTLAKVVDAVRDALPGS